MRARLDPKLVRVCLILLGVREMARCVSRDDHASTGDTEHGADVSRENGGWSNGEDTDSDRRG